MNSLFLSITEMLHGIETYHDYFTKEHEYRTGKLMKILGKTHGLDHATCSVLEEVGSIHDIGKIAIPQKILEKPMPLTEFEKTVVRQHPVIGYDFIKKINHPNAEIAGIVILMHHENYDGSGYPNGKSGKEIPIEAAICRICDCYDAMRERRPYRREMSHEDVIKKMYDTHSEGMYHKFNPELLETFKLISEKIHKLYSNNEI